MLCKLNKGSGSYIVKVPSQTYPIQPWEEWLLILVCFCSQLSVFMWVLSSSAFISGNRYALVWHGHQMVHHLVKEYLLGWAVSSRHLMYVLWQTKLCHLITVVNNTLLPPSAVSFTPAMLLYSSWLNNMPVSTNTPNLCCILPVQVRRPIKTWCQMWDTIKPSAEMGKWTLGPFNWTLSLSKPPYLCLAGTVNPIGKLNKFQVLHSQSAKSIMPFDCAVHCESTTCNWLAFDYISKCEVCQSVKFTQSVSQSVSQ